MLWSGLILDHVRHWLRLKRPFWVVSFQCVEIHRRITRLDTWQCIRLFNLVDFLYVDDFELTSIESPCRTTGSGYMSHSMMRFKRRMGLEPCKSGRRHVQQPRQSEGLITFRCIFQRILIYQIDISGYCVTCKTVATFDNPICGSGFACTSHAIRMQRVWYVEIASSKRSLMGLVARKPYTAINQSG